MNATPSVGGFFIALAVLFVALTLRDFLNAEAKMTTARRIWLRLAIVFSGIGMAYYLLLAFFH